MSTTICLVNHEGNALPFDELQRIAAAISIQIAEDFGPIWNRTATVVAARDASEIPKGAILVVCQTTMDVDGAIAYHTVRGHKPEGVCSEEFAVQVGAVFSSVVSHEILEILANRMCNKTVLGPLRSRYFREVSDPVQEDWYSVDVEGVSVPVSDFVTPDWFRVGSEGPWNFLETLSSDHQIAPGGYCSFYDEHGKPHQVFGEGADRARHRIATKTRAVGSLNRIRRHKPAEESAESEE
jgi:hypothetical protein